MRALLYHSVGRHRPWPGHRKTLCGAKWRKARYRESAGGYHRDSAAPRVSRGSRVPVLTGSTVLIVDDERTLARAIKTFMAEAGYEAEVAGDAERDLELLESM